MGGSNLGDAVATEDPASKMLSVSLVDIGTVLIGGRTLALRRRKLMAMIGYLLLSDTKSASRERLLGLLWSEVPDANARTSLRQTLFQLRQLFDGTGYDGLRIDKLNISFDTTDVSVDVWSIIIDAEEGRVHPALLEVNFYCEKILAGLEDVDSAFRTWIYARRQSLHDRLSRLLEDILNSLGAQDEERSRAAEALTRLDPTHEPAIRFLMQQRAKAGNLGGALKLYKSLWDVLEEEYGMEPSQETQQLVIDVKSGKFELPHLPAGGPDGSESAPTPAAEPNFQKRLVLAIEPFSIEGVAPTDQHLLKGFRHFIMGSFIRFREWTVLDLTSPLVDDMQPKTGFLIQATVLAGTERSHIVLTLKDISARFFVWSERFELSMTGWMALHQRVVRSVTAALNIHLSANRIARISGSKPIPSRLYDTWLRGQLMIGQLDPEDWERASKLFEDVIAQAPDFAPAYSSLVQLKNSRHIVHPGLFRNQQGQLDALKLAQKAAQLDPIDSRAQLSLAWAYAFNCQYENAELHFGLARELNELDPWTLMSVAQGFAFLDQADKARSLAVEGLANCLGPQPLHWGYLAGIYFFIGDHEEAYDAAVKAGNFLPNNGAWRAAALVRLGRLDDARAEAAQCIALIRARWADPDNPDGEDILRWLMELFPIRREKQKKILRQCLIDAGFQADRDAP